MNSMIFLVLNTLAVVTASYVLPGVHVAEIWQAFIVAIVLSAVMTFIRPLFLALTLPINVLTLGLFTFVINAVLVLLVANIVPGFSVDSFWWALGFSIVLAVFNSVLHAGLPESTRMQTR